MYDSSTIDFIKTAKPLSGLDLDELPRVLTEAYAQVVAARLRLAEGGQAQLGIAWPNMSVTLGRLAATYEVTTLLWRPDHPQRSSTAFVAASAHHARARAQAVVDPQSDSVPLNRFLVSPRLSACLLYVIGGHQADAAEVGRTLLVDVPASRAEALVDAVGRLAIARGDDLLYLAQIEPADPIQDGPSDDRAVDRLMYELLEGVRAAAARLLGSAESDAHAYFERVVQLTSDGPSDADPIWGFTAPGLRHLALLLIAATGSLFDAAVVSVPPPSGVSETSWRGFVSGYAMTRPLLWRNHRAALASGLLDQGRSSVMSFPTGAGKSALAEFRSAADCIRGRRVVYLAPTKALVAQVRRQLSAALHPLGETAVRTYLGEDSPDIDDFDVAVMTPEACLILASTDPSAVEGTGLIIFDECHLLSGVPAGVPELPHRRAVDANLALIEMMRRCPDADVLLLSAMVSNADQLAAWIESVTGRPCTPQRDAWKPTRQIRGVLAYPRKALSDLRETAQTNRRAGGNKSATEREMEALPWGVFCHKQAWDRNTSFKAIPMLSTKVPLKLNDRWEPTANRNVVAGRLAAAFVKARIQPLIFVQDVKGTMKAAETLAGELSTAGFTPAVLDPALLRLAAVELGSDDALFLPPGNLVGCHHALLLPTEREAIENAYRSADGLVAMVATPTLAQGMNMPAQVVIIGGDNRWEDDDEGGRPVILPVHEILNAAGRAGRAGMFAQGLVFLIPGMDVFSIENRGNTIDFDGLRHTMSLLGSPDQCLAVTDPLQQVMDRAARGGDLPEVCEYFLRRFRHAAGEDTSGSQALLRSSLGYIQASNAGSIAAAEARIASTLLAAAGLSAAVEDSEIDDLARALGVPHESLRAFSEAMPDDARLESFSVADWTDWLCAYLKSSPQQLPAVVHLAASGLTRIFIEIKDEAPTERLRRIANGLESTVPRWVGGVPLSQMEPKLFEHSGRKNKAAKFDLARRFHNETAAALGSTGYLIRRIVALKRKSPASAEAQLHLDALPGCLGRGFDSPAKLALHQALVRSRHTTRMEVHALFPSVEGAMQALPAGTPLDATVAAARKAARAANLL